MFGAFKKIEPHRKGAVWPEPRSGHRMCADDNFLYVFGGYNVARDNVLYNELWRYNITTGHWVKLPDDEHVAPKECTSHTMLLWRNHIIIFGGSGYPFGKTNSDKLLMYSLKSFKWIDLNKGNMNCAGDWKTLHEACGCCVTQNHRPSAKYGHSMIVTPNSELVVFAGTIGRQFPDELHTFDLYERNWKKYTFCDEHGAFQPSSRYRHDAVLFKNEYFIFGGSVMVDCFGFNEIHALEIDKMLWKRYPCLPNNALTETDTKYPGERTHHSCVCYKSHVFMIGGLNHNTQFNDVWMLDVDVMKWQCSAETFPYKVHFHAADVTSDGRMFIFGGVGPDQQRVSDLHSICLQVPSLVEQSWFLVTNLLKSNQMLKRNVLIELGVPKNFLHRIDDSVVAAG